MLCDFGHQVSISFVNISKASAEFVCTTMLLHIAHRGFKAGENNIASATTRWGFYLLSLKRYLETGKGTPNPDDTDLIR